MATSEDSHLESLPEERIANARPLEDVTVPQAESTQLLPNKQQRNIMKLLRSKFHHR